jgi:hypothetical protein
VAEPPWTERRRQLIQQYPTFGYRRLWVLLRCQAGIMGASQRGLSSPEAEAMVRASPGRHSAPPRTRVGESGEPEQ